MYPLPIYLIGCPDGVRHGLTGPVGNAGGSVAGAFSSVAEAAARLRPTRVTAVLVVAATDPAAEHLIRELREALPRCPVLAVADPARFAAALEAGAAQAVMTPLAPGDCEAALGILAEQYAEAVARPSGGGRVVAVTGASGGVGATTLAVNLAVELADLGATVVLAEPTATVGRLALFLGVHPAYTSADLFADGGRVAPRLAVQALHPISDRLRILSAEHRPVRTAPPPADAAAQIVAAVGGEADFVLLDLPCTYDDPFFDALAAADTAVLVGDQRIPSVRTLQMLTEVLQRAGTGTAIRVVINRYDPGLAGFSAANLREMLQVPAVATVAADPKATAEAENAGKPLKAVAPRSPARYDIARLARSLDGDDPGDEPAGPLPPRGRAVGHSGPPLLGRLARAFGFAGGVR